MKASDMVPYPREEAEAALRGERRGAKLMTMRDGEWDDMLERGYDEGFILIVQDTKTGAILKAFKKEEARAVGR